MSIRGDLVELVKTKRLFKLDFKLPGPPERRTVLMTAEVHELVSGPGLTPRWGSDAPDYVRN